MTFVRLVCCTLALAVAACATPVGARQPTTPVRYELCTDPAFGCGPASLTPAEQRPIRIDTNLAAPRRGASLG